MSVTNMLHLQASSSPLVLAILSKSPEKTGEQVLNLLPFSSVRNFVANTHLTVPSPQAVKFPKLMEFPLHRKGPIKTFAQ